MTTALDSAMARAVAIARQGPTWGENPRVGAVLVDASGALVAEGWHRGAGTAHAEVDALSRVPAGTDLSSATLVVTLEPCNHSGRTGPCSEAVLAAGVGSVVYAVPDPGDQSSGGAARLARAGVAVSRYSGPSTDDAAELVSRWVLSARLRRPHVTVKWASSLDGRAAAADGTSQWITGPAARHDVHRRRAEADVIVVGTGTLLADDPALTARDAEGALLPHQPAPLVIGRRPVPAEALVRDHPGELRTDPGDDLPSLFSALFAEGVRSVFVEGGPTLIGSLIEAGLADEAVVYLAPTLLGGPVTATGDLGVPTISAQRRLALRSIDRLGDDIVVVAGFTAPDTAHPDEAASEPRPHEKAGR